MNQISNVKQQLRLQEWSRQIEECQSSGMTVKQWCTKQNIRTNTYYQRLKKIREHTLEAFKEVLPEHNERTAVFKPLEVQSPVYDMQPNITVRLPSVTVEINNGVDFVNVSIR